MNKMCAAVLLCREEDAACNCIWDLKVVVVTRGSAGWHPIERIQARTGELWGGPELAISSLQQLLVGLLGVLHRSSNKDPLNFT